MGVGGFSYIHYLISSEERKRNVDREITERRVSIYLALYTDRETARRKKRALDRYNVEKFPAVADGRSCFWTNDCQVDALVPPHFGPVVEVAGVNL